MISKYCRFLSTSVAFCALSLASLSNAADAPDATHRGRSTVYGNLSNGSLEAVSTPDAMMA